MKKLLVIFMIVMLSGCAATIKESELFQHDSVYADLGHMWFSFIGYRDVDQSDVNKSRDGKWWGITKIYYPNKAKSDVNP